VIALGMPNKLIAEHEQYERLGKTDGERQLAYRDLFGNEFDSSELGEIRDTVNRGWPLGSERFEDEIERALAIQTDDPSEEARGPTPLGRTYRARIIRSEGSRP
jgi:hypothetical protein